MCVCVRARVRACVRACVCADDGMWARAIPMCISTLQSTGEFPNVAAADPVRAATSECVDYVGFMARTNPTTALWTCEMMAERQYCQVSLLMIMF